MNEWINVRKGWRGTGRRSRMLAAMMAMSPSVDACGRSYESVEIPESVQTPEDNGSDGVAGTGNAGTGADGNDATASNDAADAGVTGRESMAEVAGNAVAGDDVSVESNALETTIMIETAPSFTDISETIYVTGDRANLRAGTSTSAEIVTTLLKEASPRRAAVGDTWNRVVYQEKTCYIPIQYVSTVQPKTESAKAASTANGGEVKLNSSWKYADFFKISSGAAMLYKSETAPQKGITACVNTGHGTKGDFSIKTQCRLNSTPKVTGGTTSAGTTSAVAVSSGMQFPDGTAEARVTLVMAKELKDKLLAEGYDVLMIRETDDVQPDSTARTVIASNMADCYMALHWDSTTNNKGTLYMSFPSVESYRNMEPVKSNQQRHHALGDSLIVGLKGAGVEIPSSGAMEMGSTQMSFSTVPFIDIELGDKASDHSSTTLSTLADGLVAGVKNYFGK